MDNVPTIDNIEFQAHSTLPGGIQGHIKLSNGVTVSVVAGPLLYGDIDDDTWEVAARKEDGVRLRLGDYDDVVGWQTREEVNEIIHRLSEAS
jgi:hypothetical protein